jgi:FkbM family methyltransferase
MNVVMRASPKMLRPEKVRNALRRRRFEFSVPRMSMHEAPGGVIELGSSYGGWMIPEGLVRPSWLCYCVGAGGDVTFDLELISRYGATVRAFDAVEEYVILAKEQADGVARFSVHQAAIATFDGPLRMQITHEGHSSSVSSAALYESRDFVELPGRTLPSLMSELGDEHIDLLKLDIEGSEYEVLPTLDLRALGVKVFATQLHHTGTVAQARALIAELGEQGYEPIACRSAVKLTFARAELLVPDGPPSSEDLPSPRRPEHPPARAGQPAGRSRAGSRQPVS